ncbi:Uncharacterised protein [Candidatus Tiddalikarchaeum anstoanum]|nr:Uncharacterised protein [Candidatus Tiddalikarchaeum anstoanum]
MIDSHFHFSFGSDDEDFQELNWNNNKVLSYFNRLLPIVKEYGVSSIYGIFAYFNPGLSKEVKKIFPGLVSGLYLMLYDNVEEQLGKADSNFDFIKFHYHIGDPLSNLDLVIEKVDKCLSLGFNKFQFHTSNLSEESLRVLNEYSKRGVNFYLAHGASALNNSIKYGGSNASKLAGLIAEGNILLGISEPTYCVMTPLEYVTNALSLGLEDNLCFETDYSFNMGKNWYDVYFKSMSETIPFNKKIYEENAKKFLK